MELSMQDYSQLIKNLVFLATKDRSDIITRNIVEGILESRLNIRCAETGLMIGDAIYSGISPKAVLINLPGTDVGLYEIIDELAEVIGERNPRMDTDAYKDQCGLLFEETFSDHDEYEMA